MADIADTSSSDCSSSNRPIAATTSMTEPTLSSVFWNRRRRQRGGMTLPHTKSDLTDDTSTFSSTTGSSNNGKSNSINTSLHSNASLISLEDDDDGDYNDKEEEDEDEEDVKNNPCSWKRRGMTQYKNTITSTITPRNAVNRRGVIFLVFVSCVLSILGGYYYYYNYFYFSSLTHSLQTKVLQWWDQEYYHVRHPLYFHKQPQSNKDIRYLTIGSSTTWGYGLEEYDNAASSMADDHRTHNNNNELKKNQTHEDKLYHSTLLRLRSTATTTTTSSSTTTTTTTRRGHRQAYPYLLSSTVHNAASKVGGSELSALCTQSIVGDKDIYDVIVLEFSNEYEKTKDDSGGSSHNSGGGGLALLAQRIRQRFPSATIVFVQLWSPTQFVTTTTTITKLSQMESNDIATATYNIPFHTWRSSTQSNHNNMALDSNKFESAIQSSSWYYQEHSQNEAMLQKVADSVHGHIVRLPRNDDPRKALATVSDWFFELPSNRHHHGQEEEHEERTSVSSSNTEYDYILSPRGHEVIAEQIRHVVEEQDILRSDNVYQQQQRNLVGTWGSGDQCQLWYETGQGMPQRYSKLQFRQFSTENPNNKNHNYHHNQKYALEVPTTSNGGSLTISNPFDEERMVYLTYMTTSSSNDISSHDNNKKKKVSYPRTQVLLNGKPSVMLDPYHDPSHAPPSTHEDYQQNDHQHLTRTTAIGFIPPHSKDNILGLKSLLLPQQNYEYNLASFRIVGVSLFPTDEKRQYKIPTEFTLSRDPTTVVGQLVQRSIFG